MSRRAAVLVLGDLGRSPRMCYHALALARDGAQVELIGTAGRPPGADVLAEPRIRVHTLPRPWRQRVSPRLFAVAAAADVARQSLALTRLLVSLAPDLILVQNPPSIPTLPVARLAARLGRARLVIDWHNFGADMLALRLGPGHAAVRAAGALERRFGRGADAHLCVSEAMRAELASRFGVAGAHVLRDRPARRAGPTPPAERRRLLGELGIDPDLPVVVTASSWSADEDFDLLLDAMTRLDAAGRPLTFLLTGDGPRRRAWEASLAARALLHVRARTVWASAEDYPRLLGSADLGLSLHRSASGVDLPMKVLDMFGAGLPVCCLDYGPVVGELVRHGENGLTFTTAEALAAQIARLVGPDRAELEALRRGVAPAAALSWEEGWRAEAREVLAP